MKHYFNLGQERSAYLMYSLCIACLFLVFYGYQFNSSDQAEHLPQVYKLIDPGLYEGDYFMDAGKGHFTIRFFYVYMVYLCSFVMPVSVVCFVFCLLSIALSVYSFMRISEFFGSGLISKVLTPVFVFFIFYKFTLGGVSIQSSSFICSSIGSSMAAYGFLQYFRKKFVSMAIVLGIGSLFQLMDAAQVFLLLSMLYFIEYGSKGVWQWGKTSSVYIICAMPMLIPMFYKQFIQNEIVDKSLYYQILYNFRNPHHFLPSHFPWGDYVKTALLTGTGMSLASVFVEKKRMQSFVKWFLLIVSGMIVYYVLLEKVHVFTIGKLQWFKTSMWMSAFSAMFIAIYVGQKIEKKFRFSIDFRLLRRLSFAGSMVLLLLLTNAKYLPLEKLKGRYQIGNYEKSDLSEVHEWIRLHTSKNSMVLTHPLDDSFSCEAQRPMPIGYKAIIHEPFFMIPWYEKYKNMYGVSIEDAEKTDVLTQAAYTYSNVRHTGDSRIRYRIDKISECKFVGELLPVLYKKGDFMVSDYSKKQNN